MITDRNFECPKVDDIKKDTEKRLECRKKCFDENKEKFQNFIVSSLNNIVVCEYDTTTHILKLKSTEKINEDELASIIFEFIATHDAEKIYNNWNYNIVPYKITDCEYDYDVLL